MFRILFLILVVIGSVAFAHAQEKKEPVKFDEFGKASDSVVTTKLVAFDKELKKQSSSQGLIINYGTDREIGLRENQIKNAMSSQRMFHDIRVTFVRGGAADTRQIKTVLWIVPPGADAPVPGKVSKVQDSKGVAYRFEKMGRVNDRFFEGTFNTFFERVKSEKTINGYILIRGSKRQIAAFEKRIRDLDFFESYASEKIIFLKKPPVKKSATVALWIIPEGAELPADLNTK